MIPFLKYFTYVWLIGTVVLMGFLFLNEIYQHSYRPLFWQVVLTLGRGLICSLPGLFSYALMNFLKNRKAPEQSTPDLKSNELVRRIIDGIVFVAIVNFSFGLLGGFRGADKFLKIVLTIVLMYSPYQLASSFGRTILNKVALYLFLGFFGSLLAAYVSRLPDTGPLLFIPFSLAIFFGLLISHGASKLFRSSQDKL